MATGKRATKGKGRGKSLAPGKVKRGLDAAEIALAIDDERIVSLAAQVRVRLVLGAKEPLEQHARLVQVRDIGLGHCGGVPSLP